MLAVGEADQPPGHVARIIGENDQHGVAAGDNFFGVEVVTEACEALDHMRFADAGGVGEDKYTLALGAQGGDGLHCTVDGNGADVEHAKGIKPEHIKIIGDGEDVIGVLRCAVVRVVSRQAVADIFKLAVSIESGHGGFLKVGRQKQQGRAARVAARRQRRDYRRLSLPATGGYCRH